MKKIIVGFGIVLVSIGMAIAATQSTGDTLASNVALDKDLTVYQDYSTYPSKPGEVGKIVRFYDSAVLSGAAGQTVNLLPAVALPAHTIIRDGYIDTMAVKTPLGEGSSNSISVVSAADIKAVSTNAFIATGISAIIPVGTAATTINVGTNVGKMVTFTTTANSIAITNLKFMVVLDVEMAP